MFCPAWHAGLMRVTSLCAVHALFGAVEFVSMMMPFSDVEVCLTVGVCVLWYSHIVRLM